MGIAPENRANVFRRFWRADNSSGGAGLGLAIVARIIEVHKGRIQITDQAGQSGCEFVIALP